ncbi:adenylate cyclase class 2 [Silvibacterium bohemicum]|uniref:Adenylate cyclase class 2 n=1 Tax=Silvibacterium bohemicum TaxID=1577686 RepID=A0A841JQJ9_9BACT|nr:class IV adenylate cyclase [Silvibacterium bohemicum]MBB6142827.1 adenylate cyclase class 2 [Silvibacterium bohemicum]
MSTVEIEVKFRVKDGAALEARLGELGFQQITPRTFERNVLYDTPDRRLRKEQAILRIRKYGDRWVLTHKCLPPDHDPQARHKHRVETETEVADGEAAGAVFTQLGYRPAFIYEKWRTEYADQTGHCVLDETPIGFFAELEGPEEWIDNMAKRLGLEPSSLMTLSYGRLFERWKQETGSPANDLTFTAIGEPQPAR